MTRFMHSTEVMETYEGSKIFEVRCWVSEELLAFYVDHKDALATTLASDLVTLLVACYERTAMKRSCGQEGI